MEAKTSYRKIYLTKKQTNNQNHHHQTKQPKKGVASYI